MTDCNKSIKDNEIHLIVDYSFFNDTKRNSNLNAEYFVYDILLY